MWQLQSKIQGNFVHTWMATSFNYTLQLNILCGFTFGHLLFFCHSCASERNRWYLYTSFFQLHHFCSWCELCFFLSYILLAGLVPHVPGACTTCPTRQVWSPLRNLSGPEEPTLRGAWFNPFGSWFRSYYACRILHQQPQRDMEPSLRTFKGPDQAFPDWVCGDCEAREHVIY